MDLVDTGEARLVLGLGMGCGRCWGRGIGGVAMEGAGGGDDVFF